MQALYLLALDPVAETTADPNSYGFRDQPLDRRRHRSVLHCALSKRPSSNGFWKEIYVPASTESRMNGSWPISQWNKTMLKKWLKAGYMENHRLYPTEEGTPQGGICSPVIANMTLDGLEHLLASHFPKRGKAGQRAKVNLIRYADDFCITGSLERTARTGSEASDRAISERTRVRTLTGEDRRHAYRARV